MIAPAHRARSSVARLLPYAAALLALPLLAPTCGGQQPGVKAFSKGSLIIPMDGCYQYGTDGSGASATRAGCGTAASDAGDVVEAYGLVYQLVRAGVPVYWVIAPGKTSATAVDVAVSLTSGPPVLKYNWNNANGAGGAAPPNNGGSIFSYVGGPFVVDGSDFAAANAVLQGLKATYSVVNVHLAQVAFQGNAAKVFAGGWNAGGAVPPKLALLNIPGGDGRYADHVLEGYLVKSGLAPACVLNNPPCADNSAGTATGTHGNIYDRLEAADFISPACTYPDSTPCNTAAGSVCTAGNRCDWKSTNLYRSGYKVLWLPHWTGPNSCEGSLNSGYTCGTGFGGCSFAGGDTCSCVHGCTANLSDAELTLVLQTIGAFQGAGNDVFGECAGIGTLEGVFTTTTPTAVNATFGDGDPASRFQTSAVGFPANGGLHITTSVTAPSCGADASGMSCQGGELYQASYFSSPYLQIGDFPYTPQSGAITEFRPASSNGATGYISGVDSLIARMSGANRLDYFTIRPAAGGAGNAVYLGGHDYSGFQGAYQIAGTRLVMNTLFNLSATCQPRNTPCQQLKNLGVCRPGTWQCCDASDIAKGYCDVAGEPVCRPAIDPPGSPETCNGLDDNCDGLVDNIPSSDSHVSSPACYDGPAPTVNPGTGKPYGTCQQGTWSCQQTGTPQSPSAAWTCVGEVLPGTETCNGLDDDCNGVVDDHLTPPGGVSSCFTGPPDAVMHSTFPPSLCAPGSWACQGATWTCLGQVLPQQEICEGVLQDYNCNGVVGDGCECVVGTTRPCYTGPAGTAGVGICRTGVQHCLQDPSKAAGLGAWDNTSCSDQVLPQAEVCGNGADEDCNGKVDDCVECTAGQTRSCYPAGTSGCSGSPGGSYACQGVCSAGAQLCVAGRWGACQGAITPGPELCDGKDDTCSGSIDETTAPCPVSMACINGVCTQPTWGVETSCDPGYVPTGSGGSGTCVPQSCPSAPCPAGQRCQGGTTCVDPCQGKSCGAGAFCSGGTCVGGGCYATGCTGSDVCRNGSCQPDVCAGQTCPAGTFCRGNYALATPTFDCVRACATVTCPTGQACGPDGFCAPDPCATQTCPAGQVCRSSGTSTSCVADPCPPGLCGANQACVDGRCGDDPCAGIVCPAGVCARGQCYASNNIQGYGPMPASGTGGTSGGGGGCGCGGGDAGPTALLLSLLALPLARRRRSVAPRSPRRLSWRRGLTGGAAALLLAGLVLLPAGCSSKKKSTPLSCAETCGTDHCVDLAFDAAHCATCTHACAASEVCVDSTCITSAAAVPTITSVSPGPVAARTTPTFTISGDRFQANAKLRVSGAGLAAAEVATAFGSSTQLTAQVDLTLAAPGTLYLQVSNPDHTISNTYALDVVTPTPVIDSLTPPGAVAGSTPTVQVAGSGFTPYAICVQRAGGLDTFIPPQSTPTATALTCTLDLTRVAPGTIQIVVRNENLVESTPRSFSVSSSDPVISSLSPNPAQQGAEIRLVVSGTGFVPGSTVQIQKGGTYLDLLTDWVASTVVQAQLSLAAYAAGSYPVRVVNPGAPASAPVTLTVSETAPLATGLAVTPPLPRLGQTGVGLALSGSGFTGTCQVEVLRQGSGSYVGPPDVVTAGGTTTPSSIQATTDMVGGGEGTWYARVSCPGCPSASCTTSAFPFEVATNVASLASVTPAGGVQGASLPATPTPTVTGANFFPGMVLRLSGLATDIPVTLVGAAPATSATFSLSLAGVDVGAHTLVAVNPGTAPSNGIAFSVTPGAPSLTSIATSCTSGCTASCAVQQGNPVTITLTGSNFGTGITTVFAEPTGLSPVDLSTVPGTTVTVVSASSIQVVLDTTQVLATSYQIWVENPNKPMSAMLPYRVSTTTCP